MLLEVLFCSNIQGCNQNESRLLFKDDFEVIKVQGEKGLSWLYIMSKPRDKRMIYVYGVRGKNCSGPDIIHHRGREYTGIIEMCSAPKSRFSAAEKTCPVNFTLSVNCGAKGSSAKMWNMILFRLKRRADLIMVRVSSSRFPQATTARCMTSAGRRRLPAGRAAFLKRQKGNKRCNQHIQGIKTLF